MKSICVYCGCSDILSQVYLEVAYQMGVTAARRGLDIIYGAGSTGLMGALADGALHAGGCVTGIIPRLFNTPQLAHTGLTHLEVVDDLHQRKTRMAELAEAFVALPGGFGTLEELFEILTWAQIGLHSKPIGILNPLHYFDPLLEMIEHARREGFIYAEHQALFTYAENPEELLDTLEKHQPPSGLSKWLTRNG
jgi:uncharacterized protein (TIGR00730 family)